MHRLAWLSNSGSFACSRSLAASKALKIFNGEAPLNQRIQHPALCRNEPSEPVSWAYSIRVDWTFLPVESERNAVRSGP